MLNELDWKILKCILEENRPVSNRELALSCNAAVNTIRKEIALINEAVDKHGFSIISKASVGNYLSIIDHELADPYIERLYDRYKRKQRMSNQYSSRVLYMARKCLCFSGKLTVEELCQELYCSRGTVLRELDEVKKVLNPYGLALKNKRGGQGLVVEGNEWNLRQCLIYQHKLFKNSIDEVEHKESVFKSLFFMLDNEKRYETARDELMDGLMHQRDFSLPILCFPKIVHYMQLSFSRRKYTGGIRFTEEQIRRAENSPEYTFAKNLYTKVGQRLKQTVLEQDILALSMLILSYESQNHRMRSSAEYPEYFEETQELIQRLSETWGYPREIFDQAFVDEWICFLYTLKNRLIFKVYSDGEASGFIRLQGIRSSDFCLLFARLYKEKHGIDLGKENVLIAFHLFHRLLKKDSYCYYAQNILVISHYGISCARSQAMNIRQGYGHEVKSVTPAEICEYVEEEPEEFDLLMTDLRMDRRRYLTSYHMPILTVEFLPFQYRCQELDDYLLKVQDSCEWTVIKRHCFHYLDLRSKEEVLQYLAGLFEPFGIEKQSLIQHLKENDFYVGLERENGIVLLPVLMDGMQQQELFILLSKNAFIWNEYRSQIFICYNRIASLKANQILNGILKKFVHISAETANELLYSSKDPLKLLYPELESNRGGGYI